MVGDDVNLYPIILLVNYWELRPGLMGARLGELLKRGITQVATFVPWQAAESDITQTLTRFLQAAAEKRMSVHLILSPEVGVHYPYSGLPKDVVSKKENRAHHCQADSVTVNLAPNAFALPSLFAPDFNKRYSSFLGRMDGFFSDLAKTQPSLLRGVTTVLSGSFWKYYRSPVFSSHSAFAGRGGDYSTHAALAFRQRTEQYFTQPEFLEPTAVEAKRWKNRALEETNRRWFYQQSEDAFRNRTFQMLRKKSSQLKTVEMELYTPEADPSATYSNFLQMVSGGHANFSHLSGLVEDAASRMSLAGGGGASAASYIHWTSMGGFRMLGESEKQFLILKSLLLLGGQGGGVLLDESEWFSFSANFRSRAHALACSLSQGDFQLKNRTLYLAPHLWSSYGSLWEELKKKASPQVKMISSVDLLLKNYNSHLLVVDPSFIITREVVQKLISWTKAGRVVVLPRSQLYTEASRRELEKSLSLTKCIDVDLGLSYRVHALGDGKLVVYDLPDSLSFKGEPAAAWQQFLTSILSLAEVESHCRLTDSRLLVVPFERKKEGLAVFVLNGTRRPVTADILFPTDVEIGDLGNALSKGNFDHEAVPKSSSSAPAEKDHRFSLEVPPLGVLPLAVDGLDLTEVQERKIAAQSYEVNQANAFTAAVSELPGFNPSQGFEEVWS